MRWRGIAALDGRWFPLHNRASPDSQDLGLRRAATAALLVAVLAVTSAACRASPRIHSQSHGPSPALESLNRRIAAAATEHYGAAEYLVGADDLLEVSLFDVDEREGEPRRIPTRVSQSGVISLPLVGQVEVIGRSALEIEELLRERYRTYIHDPQVTVFVKEHRSYRVSVVGHVEKPGLYEITGQKTLLEVLGLAGGLNAQAGTTVQLTRETRKGLRTHNIDLDRLVREGDLRFNVPLRPGDVIHVPKAGVFYVEGSVIKPGEYPVRGRLTVMQAIATAGGADQRLARIGGTRLYRRGPNGRTEVPIDMGAIRSGKSEDMLVRENDVIVVPMNRWKYMIELLLGRVGVGISAGTF